MGVRVCLAFVFVIFGFGWLDRARAQDCTFERPRLTPDFRVIERLDGVPGSLLKWRNRVTAAQGASRPELSVFFPARTSLPPPRVSVTALMESARETIRNYSNIVPSLGDEDRWSPEARSFLNDRIAGQAYDLLTLRNPGLISAPPLVQSKLFLLLSAGFTPEYLPTGCEEELGVEILKEPDLSVGVALLFEKSYLLAKGDLYLALLTAENVLAKGNRDAMRNSQPIQKKLEIIRGDPNGDNYSAWYHFFGMALYASRRRASAAHSVALIERLGGYGLGNTDRQKGEFNFLGAQFGKALAAEVSGTLLRK